VELNDHIAITTPEGITVELRIAGIGSRFMAGLLDVAIETAAAVVVLLTFDALGLNRGFGAAFEIAVIFAVLFGYHILFELFNNGRTPGKAAAGIRVVQLDGLPVDAGASAIRNLVRLVDGWMVITFFLAPIGFVAAFSSRYGQRLGDLAAGTVVVRERLRPTERTPVGQVTTPRPVSLDWDVGGLSADELTVVQRFLERRFALAPDARAHLARDLAARLRARVPGADGSVDDEQFLEWVLARRQGRA
jgi:uncharacterized RDD family membrane protein YckC